MFTKEQIETLHKLPLKEVVQYWDKLEKAAKAEGSTQTMVRWLCLADLFYLLVRVCGRTDMINQFAFDRCREVEKDPDNRLDLWAREHFKSSVITFGLTVQDILKDPDITFGLFSHTRPIAKAFLRQIMREFESNKLLHAAFPDILWGEDIRQAPKWALDIDTPILTTIGWKAHGNLAVGDKIYGSSGQIIKVTGNSGYMVDADCYKVVFDDCEIIASSEHLWPVQHMYGHTWDESEIMICQTDELTIGKKTNRMLPTPIIQGITDERVGRYIRAVEQIPSVTVNCIKVDAPDSLYLAGYSMVPTHNSEDDGIIVKRKSNPKEATIEAWGLVDGQPTSKHYKILLYDDIVVQGSVSNPEMIQKTMTALEQSYNLGVATSMRRRFVGTRWHFNDAYRTIRDRGTAIPREYPGRVGGTEEGESIFWADEIHLQKRRDMGPYTYAAQILLNPKADALQGFRKEWLKKYKTIIPKNLNWYVLVDAASSKKKGSDYTSIWAVGLGKDSNYYCIPVIRDRLNLKERSDALFNAHRTYKPIQVRYEKYGMMSDIEHMESRMESENYRFKIHEVAGQTSKEDRIKRLLPLFEAGRIWIPETRYITDWQKTTVDLVHSFIEEEYTAFPVGLHDDMLDALARIAEPEMKLVWPKEIKEEKEESRDFGAKSEIAWMA